QRVKGVEELFLRPLPSGEKLHVVENQHIDAAHFLLEFAHAVAPERTDQFVHEDLGRHEQDFAWPLTSGAQLMSDRRGEMGFAETHTAIDKKRIVFFSGLISYRLGGSMSKLVAGADDEFSKRITRVWLAARLTPGNCSRVNYRRRRQRRPSGRRLMIAVAVLLFDYQRYVDTHPRLGGKRLTQQFEVAL